MKMIRNMKCSAARLLCAAALVALCFGTVSCNKRCRCTKNNLQVDYYSQEELSAQGKSCAEMAFVQGLAVPYYTLCEWEF